MRFRLNVGFGILLLLSAVVAGCGGGGKTGTTLDAKPAPKDMKGDTALSVDGLETVIQNGDGSGEKDRFGMDMERDFPVYDGDIEGTGICEVAPGTFGCPCVNNTDCAGGYCISSTRGNVCTQECIEECPLDWACSGSSSFGVDLVFVCVPPLKEPCLPCKDNSECGDDTCVELDGAWRCLFECAKDEECPLGYVCQAVPNWEALTTYCIPQSGSCSCLEKDHMKYRPCVRSNDYGNCGGFQLCDFQTGWGACSALDAIPEVCDGKDNDCDGKFDEEQPDNKACAVSVEGVGACQGIAVCGGSAGWICPAPTPEIEVCDFLDNDCDGVVDNGFQEEGRYVTHEYCGSCTTSCEGAVAHGTAYCNTEGQVPQCMVLTCEPGYYPANGFQCLPVGQTQCEPCFTDAQCEGGVCAKMAGKSVCLEPCDTSEACPSFAECKPVEGKIGSYCAPQSGDCLCTGDTTNLVRPCGVSTPFGICYATETCDPAVGWSGCSAPLAAPEACDGLDNDCDGIPDDGLAGGEPCTVTVENVGTCEGIFICYGEQGWRCGAPTPELESCDYKDNDCDGLVDEDFRTGECYTDLHHCGGCNKDCEGSLPNAVARCEHSEPPPRCVVDSCLEGFYKLNDFQCIPPPDVQCTECTQDSQCFLLDCVELEGAKHCLKPCLESSECDEGFTCSAQAEQPGHCYPDTGSCRCDNQHLGLQAACRIENSWGTCFGVKTCLADVGWGACAAKTPSEEICNGLDDNCDGLFDEGLPATQVCEVENSFGTCYGDALCMGTPGWVCMAPTPTAEYCDYLDNNCDGEIDETYRQDGKYVDDKHCGACANACLDAIPNAMGVCDGSYAVPRCVVKVCDPGYVQISPFQCIIPPDTTCQACTTDSECLGATCVVVDGESRCAANCGSGTSGQCLPGYLCQPLTGFGDYCLPVTGSCMCSPQTLGIKRTCSTANTFGTCYGVETCTLEGWSSCNAPAASSEDCNGRDDDCDGLMDEGLPAFMPCDRTNEFGKCTGQSACAGALGWVCQAATPAAEVCDFLDNNCNGEVDEPFKAGGKYVQDQHCGACNNPCADAIPNATAHCDGSYPTPKCVVTTCNEGYFQVSPFQCIVPPDSTCYDCLADQDCMGGACVLIDGESKCVAYCGSQEECGGDTTCTNLTGTGQVCFPVSGSCTCNSYTSGSKRSCSQTTQFGICYGFETCSPLEGWGACSAMAAVPETCNGADDDCNGFIDDDLPPSMSCSRSNQWGLCEGLAVCLGPAGWVCQAALPAQDLCDYLDNNCDGVVDEAFKSGTKYVTDDHCGACNNSCDGAIANATAMCDPSYTTPRCVVAACDPGFYQISAFQCIVPPDSTCFLCQTDSECMGGTCALLDGEKRCLIGCESQADCSGETACQPMEGLGTMCRPVTGSCTCGTLTHGFKRSCSQTNPIGTCYGFETCDGQTGWSTCDARLPAPEVCNGIDDDCNAAIDDALPDVQSCEHTNEWGTCTGVAICSGQLGWVCQAALPAQEVCDYRDNDCDGIVDEEFKLADKYVTGEHCGSCNNPCVDAIPNATGMCDPTPTVPRCVVETCDPGYYKLSAYQCVIPPDTSCQPCTGDKACYGSPCVAIDGQMRCAPTCTSNQDCGENFACLPYAGLGTLCQPKTGSCECGPMTAGSRRGCHAANEFGTCYGFEVCDPLLGWSSCDAWIPEAETCDGKDNDCDNGIDEDLPATIPCTTENEFGACQGQATCGGTLGWLCNAATPIAELCDHLDNNCNGAVDEEFRDLNGVYDDYYHCGECNLSCRNAVLNGTARCEVAGAQAACKVDTCNPGYFSLGNQQCLPNTAALCETCTVNLDCASPKFFCATYNLEKFCTMSCAGEPCPTGFVCQAVGPDSICIPSSGSCACDGSNLSLSRACTATWPLGAPEATADAVCFGVQPCTTTGWGPCILPPETCDGLDNDCDGTSDEDFMIDGRYVANQHCGVCGNDCTNLPYENVVGFCETGLPTPSCDLDCINGYFNPNGQLSDGCECLYVGTFDEPDTIDQNCDGIDGEKDNALFVASWGDDTNSGLYGAPLRTIHFALLASASSGKRDIYVAGGYYPGSLVLTAGVKLYGGYSDDFTIHDSIVYRSRVAGDVFTPQVPAPLTAVGIGGTPGSTVVDGFYFEAANAVEPGSSSYGAYVKDCGAGLVLKRNHFDAGNGAPGNPGGVGGNGTMGQAGVPGLAAVATLDSVCNVGLILAGGTGGLGSCGTTATSGGKGGDSYCPTYEGGPQPAENGTAGLGSAPGLPGLAGWDGKIHHASCKMCTFPNDQIVEGEDGFDGAPGTNGPAGMGCSQTSGGHNGLFWVPAMGLPAGTGLPGSGGGGGGSGGGGDSDTSKCMDVVGGTGGGGGSGGCPGTGGTGGHGGGGSFALFVVFSAPPASVPKIENNFLLAGYGGAGGQGGTGGSGGAGGAGAPGGAAGASDVYCTFGGGAGGYGGTGGHGGGGGGGCGGVSFCQYAIGQGSADLTTYKIQNVCVLGAAGAGGLGGVSFGIVGQNGQSGTLGASNF